MVGQSLAVDMMLLEHDPRFQIKLEDLIGMNFRIFDTYNLASSASERGVNFSSVSLRGIAYYLGIPHKYRDASSQGRVRGLRGWHNASNDAAYTMMCMLLFALRWNDITGPNKDAANLQWQQSGVLFDPRTAVPPTDEVESHIGVAIPEDPPVRQSSRRRTRLSAEQHPVRRARNRQEPLSPEQQSVQRARLRRRVRWECTLLVGGLGIGTYLTTIEWSQILQITAG